eukprot:1607806-Pleurochrysis_carterae.AAC.6
MEGPRQQCRQEKANKRTESRVQASRKPSRRKGLVQQSVKSKRKCQPHMGSTYCTVLCSQIIIDPTTARAAAPNN